MPRASSGPTAETTWIGVEQAARCGSRRGRCRGRAPWRSGAEGRRTTGRGGGEGRSPVVRGGGGWGRPGDRVPAGDGERPFEPGGADGNYEHDEPIRRI